MDSRDKFTTCKKGNSRLLDIAFEIKSLKENTKGQFLIFQIHTSNQEIPFKIMSFVTNAVINTFTTATSLT